MATHHTEARSARCYGYAVVPAEIDLPRDLMGLEDAPLEKLADGDMAIVVSTINAERVRPERKHLSAHFKVISALSATSDMLPMSFGLIFDDRIAAGEVLKTHADLFARQLGRVSECVEMGLRLKWHGVDVFNAVVEAHPTLRDMREQCFSAGTPRQSDLLDLGQAFERALNQDRERNLDTVKTVLGPVCADTRSLSPADETVSVNIACLVARSRLKAFDTAVERLGEIFDDNHLLEVDGPLPPFNFVDVRL